MGAGDEVGTRRASPAASLLLAVATAALVLAGFALLSAHAPEPERVIDASRIEPVSADSIEDGHGAQRMSLRIHEGRMVPERVYVRAGEPMDVQIASDDADGEEVTFQPSRIRVRVARRATTVRLPAMNPGLYEFTSSESLAKGRLIVR